MTMDEVIEAMQKAWGIEFIQTHDRVGAMRAALKAAEKQGWKLTPRQWSQEMFDAGNHCDPGSERLLPHVGQMWEAMHDAAPSRKEPH
jgi:hypothetical protein